MPKNELILMRVDPATKRRIAEAAESQGLTLTSFLIRAAEAAAGAVEKKRAKVRATGRPSSRQSSGACPSFFKTPCLEARRVGDQGYMWAGRKLLETATSLVAWDTDEEL